MVGASQEVCSRFFKWALKIGHHSIKSAVGGQDHYFSEERDRKAPKKEHVATWLRNFAFWFDVMPDTGYVSVPYGSRQDVYLCYKRMVSAALDEDPDCYPGIKQPVSQPYFLNCWRSVPELKKIRLYRQNTFTHFGQLSGLVPMIGIVSGRCFAGNAVLLGCCDVIIATEGSNIGIGGPAMIRAASKNHDGVAVVVGFPG